MSNEQFVFLREMLVKSYGHNRRIQEMERAARGLVRLGGHDRIIDLDGLKFEIVENVLDVLGVPADESRRKRFRNLLLMAGRKEPDPAKIEKHLRRVAAEVGRMNN